MLGLEIQINDETPFVAAAENFSYALLDVFIYIAGLDYSNTYLWFYAAPQVGDKVIIQVVETSKASPPQKTKKKDRKEMLERYAQLKKELEEKGLIAKED